MSEHLYLRRAFANSSWNIFSKIFNMLVGFIVSVIVTRYLGVNQKGELANSTAIVGFFGFISSFGLLDIMISRFSRDKENSGKVAASGMFLMLAGGVIAFIFSIIAAISLGVEKNVLIYVIISAISYFFQFLTIFEYWFYSNSNSKFFAISQSLIHILFILLRYLGVPLKLSLMYFVTLSVSETVLIYISLPICYKISNCYFSGIIKPDLKIIKELLKLALPMIIMGFATTVYMKVDQIMIGKMIGNSDLGIYSVAVTLAEYWYFIPAAIYSSFLPLITESYYKNTEEFHNRLLQFSDILTFIGYSAALFVMCFGSIAITMLYGNEFKDSSCILTVYIWTGFFTCISYSGQAYYIIHKDTKIIMIINLMGALLNFLLNCLLIRLIGGIGAAFATLIEYALITFGQMIIFRKKFSDLYYIQLKSLFPFFRIFRYLKAYVDTKKIRKY